MQSELPKQFMLLLDSPILMHTLERFAMAYEDIEIVLVLPEDQIPFWKNLCAQMDFDIPHTVVQGGATRYLSVQNGIRACGDCKIVGIHDGVRPLVTLELIKACYEQAAEKGSALPVVRVTQSLRRVKDDQSEVVDRTGMMAVQPPQCFAMDKLRPCYEAKDNAAFTDDATVFEQGGHVVHLIDGEETNLKITTPGDLLIAEALMGGGKKKGKR